MGPLHLLVLAFDKPNFEGWVVEQLDLLRAAGIIRVVDALAVYKDPDGDIAALQESDVDLEERIMIGGIIGGLLGLGAGGEEGAIEGALQRMEALAENEFGLDEDDILDIADDLPNDSAALILLFEHTWAIGLQQAVIAAGGTVVAQGLLDPLSLIEMGAAMGEDDDDDDYDDDDF